MYKTRHEAAPIYTDAQLGVSREERVRLEEKYPTPFCSGCQKPIQWLDFCREHDGDICHADCARQLHMRAGMWIAMLVSVCLAVALAALLAWK
jgi:hypothetical protein